MCDQVDLNLLNSNETMKTPEFLVFVHANKNSPLKTTQRVVT